MAAASNRPIPPGRSGARASPESLALARFIADLLDQKFVIPGTSIRVGLDPLIGLIPGLGDAISNVAGSVILFVAARAGVPKVVLLRMGLNIAANAAIGSIPILGDVFSIWFRSNVKNAQLLERHATGAERPSTLADWLVVAAVLIGAIAVMAAAVAAVTYLVRQVWSVL